MKTHLWTSTVPDNFETIRTYKFHCQQCGAIHEMIVPNDIIDREDEIKYWMNLAQVRQKMLHNVLKLQEPA